jgi:hypothetical protein
LSGEQLGKWNNGFYVTGTIGEKTATFLIDSGSTSMLLSVNFYKYLQTTENFPLRAVTSTLRDMNGIQGSTDLSIQFKEGKYTIPALVCDITQDAILGQDFLLRYVNKIDYQKLQISIGKET